VLDGAVIRAVDMTFALVYREKSGVDTTLVEWSHHFDPKPGADFTATAYAVDEDGVAGPAFTQGDQLVFRYTATNATATTCWTPNGDGAKGGGEIPNFTFPK
jgi:hypothetical protein